MFVRRSRYSPGSLLPALLTVLAAGCERPTEIPQQGMAQLVVQANVSSTTIATMVIEVSAADINPALVFNLPISNGKAEGPIEIPAGSNRKLDLKAFDANGIKTHEGSKTLATVVPGSGNGSVAIQLNPIPGQQPVVVTFGSFGVVVTGALSVTAGSSTQLTANVADAQGNPVSGATVQWATANPSIASVSATGLVTGVAAGAVKIVATYKGVAGEVTVTVN